MDYLKSFSFQLDETFRELIPKTGTRTWVPSAGRIRNCLESACLERTELPTIPRNQVKWINQHYTSSTLLFHKPNLDTRVPCQEVNLSLTMVDAKCFIL